MLAAGGACAGLIGALQLWTYPSVALERWPLPLAFAGITVAAFGLGSARGMLAASVLFAIWLNAPGTLVSIVDPGWGSAVAALLLFLRSGPCPASPRSRSTARPVAHRHRETF